MSGRFKDITGHTFGNWNVLRREGTAKETGRSHATWLCRCICGTERILRTSCLTQGKPASCGCKRGSHRHTANPRNRPSPEYAAWINMHQRCKGKTYPSPHRYRNRGIGICERWQSPENFLSDMGPRPSAKHTLERIDNDKGYSPENCRWATRREQANNRATNIRFEYQGELLTLADLARKSGASREMLRSRLCRSKKAWTVEDAITFPNRKGKSYKPH